MREKSDSCNQHLCVLPPASVIAHQKTHTANIEIVSLSAIIGLADSPILLNRGQFYKCISLAQAASIGDLEFLLGARFFLPHRGKK